MDTTEWDVMRTGLTFFECGHLKPCLPRYSFIRWSTAEFPLHSSFQTMAVFSITLPCLAETQWNGFSLPISVCTKLCPSRLRHKQTRETLVPLNPLAGGKGAISQRCFYFISIFCTLKLGAYGFTPYFFLFHLRTTCGVRMWFMHACVRTSEQIVA